MRVFLWHVHGSYTTALVQGKHEFLVPVLPARGPDGRGRARTWDWPPNAIEVSPQEARHTDVDVVVLQRPEELHGLARQWLGRRPGRDVPALYLEHNAPEGDINDMHHPASGHPVELVHVTHFNDLFWDAGPTPTRVIEHGVVDPGYGYTGGLARAAAVVNDPVRRGRVTGTDLLERVRRRAPVDLFGMRSESLGGKDLPQAGLHGAMAQRRVYLHLARWTSLGLSLIEAMHLGMPVVALATTEVAEAVSVEAGVLSTRFETIVDAVERLLEEPDAARDMGMAARRAALARFGLDRFLADWDRAFEEVPW